MKPGISITFIIVGFVFIVFGIAAVFFITNLPLITKILLASNVPFCIAISVVGSILLLFGVFKLFQFRRVEI
ncbi:hypothetical protein H8E88_02140 [candidate division KSB1 bacterium]|nr:hypothetical protein [candidate division KSB1 bacterium]